MIFKELDVVKLRHASGGVGAGASGTVLEDLPGETRCYLVEFSGEDGETIAMLELSDSDLEPAKA